MKKTTWTCTALMVFAVPQLFAAIEMELNLNANGTQCTLFVNTGGVITTSGACANLSTSLSGGDHGQLSVATKANLLFGGIKFSDTVQGHGFVSLPELQAVNQTQAQSSATTGTFTSIFTDTDVATGVAKFGVSTTLNSVTSAGTGDFFAFNSPDLPGDVDVIPAVTLIGKSVGQKGPVSTSFHVYQNNAPGTPYSLTSKVVIHFLKKNQSVTGNQQISAFEFIPEPASIVLMGTMLLSIIGFRRKQGRQ